MIDDLMTTIIKNGFIIFLHLTSYVRRINGASTDPGWSEYFNAEEICNFVCETSGRMHLCFVLIELGDMLHLGPEVTGLQILRC